MIREWETPHRPTALALDDGRLFCGWADTGEVEAFRWSDGATLWRTPLGVRQVAALALHDGRLAVGSRASSLLVLDAVTGAATRRWRGLESDGQSIAWLPDGAGVLATGNGGDVRAWSAGAATDLPALEGFANPSAGGRALCLSDDGTLVAATAPGGAVRVVESASGRERVSFARAVAPVTFDDSELWLLTPQALERHPLAAGAPATASVPLPWTPIQAAISLRGGRAAFTDRGARLGSVSLAGGAPVTRDSGHTGIWWVAVSNDGRLIATGGRDSRVRLWRADNLELVREWKSPRPALYGSFSPTTAGWPGARTTGTPACARSPGRRRTRSRRAAACCRR
ncbi:WD40 repeat domain-containing protein [Oleiharenicola sp. Vm1]|uniref:WD40 repeat domain-containing protein n=1 Tax=Oleiharenicola sp. Vm1 TaxID=3398393 RepID=UPI0039F611E7